MAKDKCDFKTMDLTGVPRVTGRPNLGLTKSDAEYKRGQRAEIHNDVMEGSFTTRSHCMYVLSKPLRFTFNQRKNAWLKLAKLDGYAVSILDCPTNFDSL